MNTPNVRNDDHLLADLDSRIKKLEDAIFPPGGPGLGAQLAALGDRIEAVQTKLRSELKDLDARQTEKIEEVYEILNQVRSAVQALAQKGAGGRTMGA
jgi:hypothetical protein